MVDPRIVAAALLFVIAIVLIAVFERRRTLIAGIGALVAIVSGLVPLMSLLPTAVSGGGSVVAWNTLALLVGLFLFAGLLRELNFFRWVAIELARRTGNRPMHLFAALTALAFVLAAFINSITVMLVLAAVTLEVARAFGRNPIPFLLAEISAANAGGAATLVGDPPNIILGTYFGLSFADFVTHTAPAAVAVLVILLLLFSRTIPRGSPEHPPIPIEAPALEKPRLALAVVAFGAMIVVLAFQVPLGIPVWVVGLGGGVAALLIALPSYAKPMVRKFDYPTLLFFFFLFVIVGALVETGGIDSVASGIANVAGSNLLLTGTLLLWSFGLLSILIDNVPLVAAAAPLIANIGMQTGLPTSSLVYATALGTDIGGNGSPIGGTANIVGLAEASRGGFPVSWRRYLKDALPITLVSLLTANLVWLVIH